MSSRRESLQHSAVNRAKAKAFTRSRGLTIAVAEARPSLSVPAEFSDAAGAEADSTTAVLQRASEEANQLLAAVGGGDDDGASRGRGSARSHRESLTKHSHAGMELDMDLHHLLGIAKEARETRLALETEPGDAETLMNAVVPKDTDADRAIEGDFTKPQDEEEQQVHDRLRGLEERKQKTIMSRRLQRLEEARRAAEASAAIKRKRGVHSPRGLYDRKRAKSRAMIMNLLMGLDGKQLSKIRDAFSSHKNDSVTLPQFLRIMRKHLQHELLGATPRALIYSLIELFESMDLDGNHDLEFEEFLATVVHMGLGSSDADVLIDPIKPYQESRTTPTVSRQRGNDGSASFAHSGESLLYLQSIDKVLLTETGDFGLSVLDPATLEPMRSFATGGVILSVEYIYCNAHGDFYDLLVAGTSRGFLIFEGVCSGRTALREEVATPHPITALRWFPHHSLLLSGNSQGDVHGWNITHIPGLHAMENKRSVAPMASASPGPGVDLGSELAGAGPDGAESPLGSPAAGSGSSSGVAAGDMSGVLSMSSSVYSSATAVLNKTLGSRIGGRFKPTECVLTLTGHTDVVTDMRVIPGMDLIFTSSLDSTIKEWDVVRGKLRQTFSEHQSGVVALAYSTELRFLYSASCDHNIGVWSPFANRLVMKLSGHAAPLISLQLVDQTSQLLSADSSGWIKVWDIRIHACVQTVSLGSTGLSSFAHCGARHARIVTAQKTGLVPYDQDGGLYSSVSNFDPVFCARYNPTLLTMTTVGRREVHLWNALTGQLSRVHRNLMPTEITAMCFDHRNRKLILGDHEGNISVFNYMNGTFMKSLTPHKAEVSYLGYCVEMCAVVSCGRDSMVRIHDETPIEEHKVLLEATLPRNAEPTACTFSYTLSLLAVATSAGQIIIWDMETGRQESALRDTDSGVVTHLEFLGKYSTLAAAHDNGSVRIWYMRPSTFAYSVAFAWDCYIDSTSPGDPVSINALAFDDHTDVLYTGNEVGLIQAWPLSSVLQKMGQKKVDFSNMADQAFFRTGRRHSHIAMFAATTNYSPRDKRRFSHAEQQQMRPSGSMDTGNRPVRSLSIVHSPTALICATDGPGAQVWNLRGHLIGSLDPRPELPPHRIPGLPRGVAPLVFKTKVSSVFDRPNAGSVPAAKKKKKKKRKAKRSHNHLRIDEDTDLASLLESLSAEADEETSAALLGPLHSHKTQTQADELINAPKPRVKVAWGFKPNVRKRQAYENRMCDDVLRVTDGDLDERKLLEYNLIDESQLPKKTKDRLISWENAGSVSPVKHARSKKHLQHLIADPEVMLARRVRDLDRRERLQRLQDARDRQRTQGRHSVGPRKWIQNVHADGEAGKAKKKKVRAVVASTRTRFQSVVVSPVASVSRQLSQASIDPLQSARSNAASDASEQPKNLAPVAERSLTRKERIALVEFERRQHGGGHSHDLTADLMDEERRSAANDKRHVSSLPVFAYSTSEAAQHELDRRLLDLVSGKVDGSRQELPESVDFMEEGHVRSLDALHPDKSKRGKKAKKKRGGKSRRSKRSKKMASSHRLLKPHSGPGSRRSSRRSSVGDVSTPSSTLRRLQSASMRHLQSPVGLGLGEDVKQRLSSTQLKLAERLDALLQRSQEIEDEFAETGTHTIVMRRRAKGAKTVQLPRL